MWGKKHLFYGSRDTDAMCTLTKVWIFLFHHFTILQDTYSLTYLYLPSPDLGRKFFKEFRLYKMKILSQKPLNSFTVVIEKHFHNFPRDTQVTPSLNFIS